MMVWANLASAVGGGARQSWRDLAGASGAQETHVVIIPDDEKAPYAGQPISLRILAALLGWQGGPLSLRSLLLLDEEVEVIELAPV